MADSCPKCGAALGPGGNCNCGKSASQSEPSSLRGFVIWVVVTVFLGRLSWFLDSNDFWRWSFLLSTSLFGIMIWHEVIQKWSRFIAHTTRRDAVIMSRCAVTWLAWTVPGFYYPGVPVRFDNSVYNKSVRIVYDDEVIAELKPEGILGGEDYYFRCRGFDEGKLRVEILQPEGWVKTDVNRTKDPFRNAALFYTWDVLIEIK